MQNTLSQSMIFNGQTVSVKQFIEQADPEVVRQLMLQFLSVSKPENFQQILLETQMNQSLTKKMTVSPSTPTIRDIQFLESQLSAEKAKMSSLTLKTQEQFKDLEKQKSLFELQKKKLMDAAVCQQVQMIQIQQQKLNDQTTIINSFMNKLQEKDILVEKLKKENQIYKEQLQKQKQKKIVKKKKNQLKPLPEVLSTPQQESSEEYLMKISQLEQVFEEEKEKTKTMIFELSNNKKHQEYTLELNEPELTQEKVEIIIQKLIRIPHQLVCKVEQHENIFDLKFQSKLVKNKMFQLLKLAGYSVKADLFKVKVTQCNELNEINNFFIDSPNLVYAENVQEDCILYMDEIIKEKDLQRQFLQYGIKFFDIICEDWTVNKFEKIKLLED